MSDRRLASSLPLPALGAEEAQCCARRAAAADVRHGPARSTTVGVHASKKQPRAHALQLPVGLRWVIRGHAWEVSRGGSFLPQLVATERARRMRARGAWRDRRANVARDAGIVAQGQRRSSLRALDQRAAPRRRAARVQRVWAAREELALRAP